MWSVAFSLSYRLQFLQGSNGHLLEVASLPRVWTRRLSINFKKLLRATKVLVCKQS